MKGFIRCNSISRNLYAHNIQNFSNLSNNSDKYDRWNLMRKAGINPCPEFNLYISNEYGAWMGNINGNIDDLSELLTLTQIDLDSYTSTPFSEFIENGYELIIGPAVPESDGKMYGKGIYCKNWQELLKNKEKQLKLIQY